MVVMIVFFLLSAVGNATYLGCVYVFVEWPQAQSKEEDVNWSPLCSLELLQCCQLSLWYYLIKVNRICMAHKIAMYVFKIEKISWPKHIVKFWRQSWQHWTTLYWWWWTDLLTLKLEELLLPVIRCWVPNYTWMEVYQMIIGGSPKYLGKLILEQN